ncbi:MAG: competence protein CoiA family protein [Alkalibacterium sp.]|nr:competence protein CoiA family protein [Alkalibacterium sp.]
MILKNQSKYYCPACEEEVIFKNGLINQSHFSHRRSSFCSSFSEGESAEHLKGKLLLYDWLKKERMDVELEAYLPELSQRPDLLIQLESERIAVEYQCSPIGRNKIISRTEGYLQNNIKVYWILGDKLKVSKSLQPKHFTYLSMNTGQQCVLLQLDQEKKQLELLTQFRTSYKGAGCIRKWVRYSDSIESFRSIYNSSQKSCFPDHTSRTYQEKKLQQLSFFKNKNAQHFFELLYLNGMTIDQLPEVIFHSVPSEWMISTFPFQWKLLMLLWLNRFAVSKVFTVNGLVREVEIWEQGKDIVHHILPNVEQTILYRPFLEFLDLLCEYRLLKEAGEGKWVRSRKTIFK